MATGKRIKSILAPLAELETRLTEGYRGQATDVVGQPTVFAGSNDQGQKVLSRQAVQAVKVGTNAWEVQDVTFQGITSLDLAGASVVGVDAQGKLIPATAPTGSKGSENAIQVAGATTGTFKDSGLIVDSFGDETAGYRRVEFAGAYVELLKSTPSGKTFATLRTAEGEQIAIGNNIAVSSVKIQHPYGTLPTHSAALGQVEDLLFEDHQVTATSTGFQYPRTVDLSYNGTTSKVTVQPCAVYWRGLKLTKFETVWESPAHGTISPNTSQWLYYDGTDYLWAATIPDGFRDMPIARVYRDGVNVCIRECHGFMDAETHDALHYGTGAFLRSGGDLSSYTIGSATATNRRPKISSTAVADEDCVTDLPALTTNAYARLTMSGASTATITVDNAEIVPLNGNIPYYYNFTGGVFVETAFPTNAYGKIFVIAIPVTDDTNCQKARYVCIAPQQVSTTLATIQAVTFSSVSLGQIQESVQEFVPIAEIIIRYSSNNWVITSVSKLSGSLRFQQSTPSISVPQDLLTFADEFDVFGTTNNVDLHNATSKNVEISTGAANRGVYLQCNTINSDGTDRYASTGATSYIGTSSAVPFSASYAPSGPAGVVPVFVNLASITTAGIMSLPASTIVGVNGLAKNISTVEAVKTLIGTAFTQTYFFNRVIFSMSGGTVDVPKVHLSATDTTQTYALRSGAKAPLACKITGFNITMMSQAGANSNVYYKINEGSWVLIGTCTVATGTATFLLGSPLNIAANDYVRIGFTGSNGEFTGVSIDVFVREQVL